MPDDPEIIAKIKTSYDATGAKEAKKDIQNLTQGRDGIIPAAQKSGEALSKIKAPAVPAQAQLSWQQYLPLLTRGATSGTLSLTALTGAAMRFGPVAGAAAAAATAGFETLSKTFDKTFDHFDEYKEEFGKSSGSFWGGLFSAGTDAISDGLSNVTISFLESQKAAGGWQPFLIINDEQFTVTGSVIQNTLATGHRPDSAFLSPA